MTKRTYQIIYEELKNRDSSLTEERFCLDYLNRSYHYTSMCKASHLDISDSSLLALYRSLNGLAITWKDIADNSPDAPQSRAHQNHLFFLHLAGLVWVELQGLEPS